MLKQNGNVDEDNIGDGDEKLQCESRSIASPEEMEAEDCSAKIDKIQWRYKNAQRIASVLLAKRLYTFFFVY